METKKMFSLARFACFFLLLLFSLSLILTAYFCAIFLYGEFFSHFLSMFLHGFFSLCLYHQQFNRNALSFSCSFSFQYNRNVLWHLKTLGTVRVFVSCFFYVCGKHSLFFWLFVHAIKLATTTTSPVSSGFWFCSICEEPFFSSSMLSSL